MADRSRRARVRLPPAAERLSRSRVAPSSRRLCERERERERERKREREREREGGREGGREQMSVREEN